MASRPRKRKAANYTGTQSNGNDAATQDMVEKCVAAILPTIRETIRDVISSQPTSAPQPTSTPQPQSSQDHTEFNSSTLQLLTGASTDTGNSTSPKQHEPSVARPVGLGVDPKIKAFLQTNLSSSLPSCLSLRSMRTKNLNQLRKMVNCFSLNQLRPVKSGT